MRLRKGLLYGAIGFMGFSGAMGGQPEMSDVNVRNLQDPHFFQWHKPDKGTLRLKILTDEILLWQWWSPDRSVEWSTPIEVSPMIQSLNFKGPQDLRVHESGYQLETSSLKIEIHPEDFCVTVENHRDDHGRLGTFCPRASGSDQKELRVKAEGMTHGFGLGQSLDMNNSDIPSDGHWVGARRESQDPFGNAFEAFSGGVVGDIQIPILYALGEGLRGYGLFVDSIYKQVWDLTQDPWAVRVDHDESLRWFVIGGPDLPTWRSQFLKLVGRPPVPPRKAFGLWVSEYGYDNWDELDDKLRTLREKNFPLDGFVMDLQWFGGIDSNSESTPMGTLTWDREAFPEPEIKIRNLKEKEGLGLILIEESYVGKALPEHDTLAGKGYLARTAQEGPPTYIDSNPWWGKGGMMDWSHPEGSAFWHDWKRQPLVEMGVFGHWVDLGEPEMYDPQAWYYGQKEKSLHGHQEVHNLYSFLWQKSIFEGYRRHQNPQRPLMLSRSATAGTQRFGAAVWSGDTGSNMPTLIAQMQAQTHMSLSGIDYYGSDVGGFHRYSLDGDRDELYTQWFANSAFTDIPLRPHVMNLCHCYETAPDRIGHWQSNLQNLRLRYELTPYYYSLAYRAYQKGEALVSPLVYHFQSDPVARTIGHQKMIGPDLMVGLVAGYGQRTRDVYLPQGTWYNYRTHKKIESQGDWQRGLPLYNGELFELPLFAREGAILPQMRVSHQTRNGLGLLSDGSYDLLQKIRVYPSGKGSTFTLFEDDGETVAYLSGDYRKRTIHQIKKDGVMTITLKASQGRWPEGPADQDWLFEVVLGEEGPRVKSIEVVGSTGELKWNWAEESYGVSIPISQLPASEEVVIQIRF